MNKKDKYENTQIRKQQEWIRRQAERDMWIQMHQTMREANRINPFDSNFNNNFNNII